MASKKDFYEVLGVGKSATADEIKRAYRKLALEWHPDRNKTSGAADKFKEINEAYAVLSDTQKRSTYDQFGHAAFAPGSGMGGGARGGNPFGGGFGGQQGPFSYSWSSTGGNPFGGGDTIDPFDIFEQFFGGGFSSGGRQAPRHPVYEMEIDFDEAVHGVTKEMSVPKGEAGAGSEHKTIKIPPGVDTGSRIRFDHFDIQIAVRPSKIFTRDGDDVVVNHTIRFSKAISGGIEEVPTVSGPVRIRIPAGTQPGTLIRLRGQGIPHVRGNGKGDEYVKVQIRIPEHLSKHQKELVDQLERSFDGE